MKKLNILLACVLVSLLTGCAAFFQPRVPMDFDASNAYLEDLLVEKEKGGKLGTPSQIIASKNKDSSSISITWSPVENAVSYRIEYAVVSPNGEGVYPTSVPEEQFNVLEPNVYGTSYEHKIKSTTIDDYKNRYDKRFFYRVTAINTRDEFEEGTPTPSNVYGTLLAPPKNVLASAGESVEYINVSWDFVKGADKYQIFRSDNETGAGAGFIASVEGNLKSFKDKGISSKDKGREFYYIVYAVTREGRMSEPGSIAMGYTLVPGAPATPKNVKITGGRGDSPDTIVLRWDKVQGEGTLVYNVFRYSSKDSALTKVGRDLKVTEFADKQRLEPNVYYNYVIQAVVTNDAGESLKSPMSLPIEGFILSPPKNIIARKDPSGVKLSWEKPVGTAEEQAKYTYKILASDTLDGEYTELLTVPETEAVVEGHSFYKMKTLKEKIESKESKAVSPAPDAATGVNVSHADYSFLGENLAANDSGVYPVKITWAKPASDEPSGYYVYRSLKEDSGYRKITNDVVNDLTYLDADETLQPGKVYYYKVLSVNSLEQGENFSGSQYGWGALTHERYLKEFNETIISSQKKLTLMHKPGSTDKLGTETKNGDISGNVYYNAAVQGLGAYITMKYTDYADFYINPGKKEMGVKFVLSGNSDTSANMSSNGTMNGIISCTGMYPGKVDYKNIEIKSGAAGGGTYGVTPEGFTSKEVVYSVIEGK